MLNLNIKLSITPLFILGLLNAAFSQQKLNGEKLQSATKANKSLTVYTTAENTNYRLSETDKIVFKPAIQPTETEISVIVNPEIKFQKCIGIGGAITDASAEVFAKLPLNKQEEFLNAYYDKDKGVGYSLARTNINSCDFSSGSYSYVQDGDKSLNTFNISHDKQYRIPLIKKATAKAGGKLLLYASPWSPPAYMKDNNNMLQGGKLLPDYYQTWASYYVKFIKAYEAEGLPIWGITVQNEPLAKQRWESCLYTAEEERDFVKLHLGPVMHKQGFADKKIIIWDHNRDLMNQRANVVFADKEASKYIWGIGFHWYETWTGGQPMFSNVANVHASFPTKNILFTEGCVERFSRDKYQFWANGERYGNAIINDFNNGTVGWTDWNILLDENGGPNHVGNFCFAPIHADTKAGELIYTPSYYYLGHFSKFIRPNATRISTHSSRSNLLSTSFVNSDGKMVTVVMNQTDAAIPYKLYVGSQAAEINIQAHAIQTLVY